MFHVLTLVATWDDISSKFLYTAQLIWVLLAAGNLYLNTRLFQKLDNLDQHKLLEYSECYIIRWAMSLASEFGPELG